MLKQTTKENIKIGTTLFLVPSSCSSHDKPHDITITKIGRKYAYFGNRDTKIDLATMQVKIDYMGIKPELWDSKEAYESSVERSKVISECRSYFTSTDITKRKKLTYKKAVKILAILNDESEVEEKEGTTAQIKELALSDSNIDNIMESQLLARGNFKKKLQSDGEYRLNDYVIPDIKAIVMYFVKIAYEEGKREAQEKIYQQEMDKIKFCSCGCILPEDLTQCSDCEVKYD